MAAAAPSASPTPPVEGVSLEQYAGVSAAVIEGFPLPAVLASEGLDARAWPRVSMRWSQRLAAQGAGGPLAVAYHGTLAFARGWLGRRVAPLDEDLGVWMAFLNAWSTHPEPFALLDQLSILPSDVTRIQGAWAQRLEKDEDLRKKALELAKKKPRAVPKVQVTPAELKPFPWSGKSAGATAAAVEEPALVKPKLSASFIGDAFGLERYAALTAELSAAKKGEAAAVLAQQALDEAGFAALNARWERRFGAEPALKQDFVRLVRYYEARASAAAAKKGVARAGEPVRSEVAAPRAELPAPVARSALAGTALALDVPRGPALPFVAGEAPDEIALPEAEVIEIGELGEEKPAAPAGPRNMLAGTALALDVPRGPALPFMAGGKPGEVAPAEAPARPRNELAGTALALDVPRGPALPFVAGGKPEGVALPEAEAPAGPKLPTGTALALDVPRGQALPFAAGEEKPAVPVKPRNKLADRALVLDMPRGPASPLAGPKPDSKPAEALPVEGTGSGGAPKAAAEPALTLAQHASMTLEIALAPEKAMEVVARYGLTAEGKRAVDEYWRERVVADAGVKEAWSRAYQTYHAWVMQRGKG